MPDPEPPAPKRAAGGRRLPRWLGTAIQLLLTVLVTWFIIDRIGLDLRRLEGMDFSGWRLRWLPLIGSVVVLLGGYGMSAALWGRMVRELGGPRLPIGRSIRLFMVANLGRYVPGKVVQLAGLTVLAAREGVRPATAAVAAVLGQGVALLGAALVGLVAFLQPGSPQRLLGWVGLAAVGGFLLLGTLPASRNLLETVWRRFERGDGTEPPPRALADPTFAWRWTLAYALNWALYAAAFWLLFLGLVGSATFLEVGPAFAAAYLIGYVAIFAPAGLGIREGSLALFLAPVLAPEPAFALAIAARIWTTGVEVIPAAVMAPRALRGARRGPPEPEGAPPTATTTDRPLPAEPGDRIP